MLERLDRELNAQGISVAFVELRGRLHELILRYGLFDTLDRDHFYPSVVTALQAIGMDDLAAGSDEGSAGSTEGAAD
jgi:hypothetical protein